MDKTLLGFTTYNHYAFTKLALKSIEKYTPELKNGRARLVAIDNNSTDETQERILIDFPWIEKFIVSDKDSIPYQWNQFLELREINEDFVICPNDIFVGPNWLKFLKEDVYSHPQIAFGSPYMPVDCAWDDIVDVNWAQEYFKKYDYIRNIKDPDELEFTMNSLYLGDFKNFAEGFQERNKDQPPLDNSLTHIMLFKSFLFDRDNFRFNDNDYPYYYGSHEFDMKAELNNKGYFNICSSRSYVHHWISISNKDSNIELSEKQKIIRKNNLKLLGKWKPIPESVYFMDGPRPKNIPNWKTPYYKFEKIEPELSEGEAAKQPGTSFMVFCGLKPGENYFDQIQVGSIVGETTHATFNDSYRYKLYRVTERDEKSIHMEANGFHLWTDEKAFLGNKMAVVYYWREEEKDLNKYWSEKVL